MIPKYHQPLSEADIELCRSVEVYIRSTQAFIQARVGKPHPKISGHVCKSLLALSNALEDVMHDDLDGYVGDKEAAE